MTTNYEDRLNAVASKIGVQPNLLELYLHEELDAFKSRLFFDGSRQQRLMQALSEDNEGVFYVLVSEKITTTATANATSDYIGVILDQLKATVNKQGFAAQYRVNNVHLATPDYFRKILNNHPETGIVSIIPQGSKTIEAVCAEMERPCLLLDYPPDDAVSNTFTLNLDNNGAIQQAMEHLFALGHERIGFITGNLDFFSAQDRFKGYKDALKKANIDYDERLVKQGDWQIASTEALALELMNVENPPTAIVASNDLMAFGAIGALHSHGFRLPQDVSIIGFDDIPMAATITPSLTTLRQPLDEMGKHAGEIMVNILQQKRDLQQHYDFSAELVVRDSTAKRS